MKRFKMSDPDFPYLFMEIDRDENVVNLKLVHSNRLRDDPGKLDMDR